MHNLYASGTEPNSYISFFGTNTANMRIYICVCICPNIGRTYILPFIILMLSISVNLYAQHDPETRVAYTCPRYDVKTQMNRVLRRINFSWFEPRMFRFPYFQTRSGEALCVHSLEFE